eukprot:754804-Hanusia_phi.AAC.1
MARLGDEAKSWQRRRTISAPLLLTAGMCISCILFALALSMQNDRTGLVQVQYLSRDTRNLAREQKVLDGDSNQFSALEEKLSKLTKDVLSSKNVAGAKGAPPLKKEVQETEKELDIVGSKMSRAHSMMNQDITTLTPTQKAGHADEDLKGAQSSVASKSVLTASKKVASGSADDQNQMLASSNDPRKDKTLKPASGSEKSAAAKARVHPLKHHHDIPEGEEDEDLKMRSSARKNVLRAFRFFQKHQQQLQEAQKAKEESQAEGYDVTPEENCKGDDCHIRLYLHIGTPRVGHTAHNGENFVPNLRDLRKTIRKRGLVFAQSGVDMCKKNPAACKGFQTVYKGKDVDVSYVPPNQDFLPVGGQAHSGVRHPIGTPDVRIPEHAFKPSPHSRISLNLQSIVDASSEPLEHHDSSAHSRHSTQMGSGLLVPAAMKIAKEQEKLAKIAKKIKKAADLRAQVALAEDTMVKALMDHMHRKDATPEPLEASSTSSHSPLKDRRKQLENLSASQHPPTEEVKDALPDVQHTIQGVPRRSIAVRLQDKLKLLNRQMRRDKALLIE